MKRTLIRLGLPLLLLGLFVGWCLWPREKVVPAVAMLLKEGMTLEQVEVLLGLPLKVDDYWIQYDYHETIENKEGRYWLGHYQFTARSAARISFKTVGEYQPIINWVEQENDSFIWLGSQICVIARFESIGSQWKLIELHISPVVRSGGSAVDWFQSEYQKWSSPPPAYYQNDPMLPPPPPPPPLPKKSKS